MLLPLLFSAFAGEAVATPVATPAPVVVVGAVEPAPVPCVVVTVEPTAAPVADVSLTPAPPASPVAIGDATTKCVTAAVVPEDGKKKKSLKKTNNNRMEAESTDE